MDNRELKGIIDQIKKKEAVTLKDIAAVSGVNRSSLQNNLTKKMKVEMKDFTVNKIAKAYPLYFESDQNQTNSKQLYKEYEHIPISLSKHMEKIDQHTAFLQRLLEGRIERMDANLSAVLAGSKKQAVYFEAVSETALESLARIEKKKPDALQRVADKKAIEKINRSTGHHMSDGVGNSNKS